MCHKSGDFCYFIHAIDGLRYFAHLLLGFAIMPMKQVSYPVKCQDHCSGQHCPLSSSSSRQSRWLPGSPPQYASPGPDRSAMDGGNAVVACLRAQAGVAPCYARPRLGSPPLRAAPPPCCARARLGPPPLCVALAGGRRPASRAPGWGRRTCARRWPGRRPAARFQVGAATRCCPEKLDLGRQWGMGHDFMS